MLTAVDRSDDDSRDALRVMTFNVLGCRGFPLEPGGVVAFDDVSPILCDALVERLRRWAVDVAILQEAPPRASMETIAAAAGMQLAFFPAQRIPGKDWPFGFPGAVLSRYPISDVVDHAAGIREPRDARFERHWGSARIDIAGRPMRVTGMHLCADWGNVNREATRLDELAAVLAGPTSDLIGTDLNSVPRSNVYRTLADAGWRDAWIESRSVGEGLTSDTRARQIRLDYLLLAPTTAWRAIAARVPDDLRLADPHDHLLLSDHHPVLVDLIDSRG